MRKDEKMGLLSKLLGGDKNAEKAAKDLLNGIIKNAQTNQSSANNNTQSNQTAANNNGASRNSPEASRTQSSSPSGFSWGENMPDEGFTFLGFYVRGKVVDIAPATVQKLKNKMRRKRDSLARWKKRNETDGERAAKAFIRMFNRKLLENAADNDLTWSNWFFPTITTAASLHEIDLYAQDCIRYLVSGKHTKARFNVRYDDMKKLGYRSLVHEYYKTNDEK